MLFSALVLMPHSAVAQPGNGRTQSLPPLRKSPRASKPDVQKTKSKNSATNVARSAPPIKKINPQEKNVVIKKSKPSTQEIAKKEKKREISPEILFNERDRVIFNEIKLETEPQELFLIRGMLPILAAATLGDKIITLPRKELEAAEDRWKRPMAIVRIQQVTVQPNVFEDEVKGMVISVKFKVSNLEGIEAKVVANFYPEVNAVSFNNVSQKPKIDFDQLFIEETFTPATEESYYDNFNLFMPYEKLQQAYSNLNEKNGSLKIKMQIQIRESDESILASSKFTHLIVR
jgi:hypothetical protein